MTPPEDLDALVEHILDRLCGAVSDPASPWRTPMLASLTADGGPTLRTVVLRAVQPAGRTLLVNTDRRSDKAGQIARRRQVELCFWNPATAQQIRIAGDARLDGTGPAADAAWSALPPEGRSIYRHGARPGTPIDRPGTPARPAIDGDRDGFALVTVVWRRWDWIWLGPDSHWRARFRWDADGSRQAEWVVP